MAWAQVITGKDWCHVCGRRVDNEIELHWGENEEHEDGKCKMLQMGNAMRICRHCLARLLFLSWPKTPVKKPVDLCPAKSWLDCFDTVAKREEIVEHLRQMAFSAEHHIGDGLDMVAEKKLE